MFTRVASVLTLINKRYNVVLILTPEEIISNDIH